jgi:hypothetical protein
VIGVVLSSWPDSFRLSTFSIQIEAEKTWMPGTRPGMTARHCEERRRRRNPDLSSVNWIASLTLAMTKKQKAPRKSRGAFAVNDCEEDLFVLSLAGLAASYSSKP